MKKLITFLIAIIFCVGCTTSSSTSLTHFNIIQSCEVPNGNLYKIEFDNHTYILYRGISKGGLLHDPDCQCKNK